jgi:CBS domain-containing protein
MFETRDRLETPVRAFMRPGVISVADDASLYQVGRALVSHGVHAVIVVAAGTGRPLGWATARGLLGMTSCDPDLTSARDAIVERPVVLSPGDTAGDAAQLLLSSGASHLLVARRGDAAPEGVVTDLDVLRVLGR